jgi:hypothetical protein
MRYPENVHRHVVASFLVALGCGRHAFELDAGDAGDAGADAPAAPVANYVFVTSTTHLPTTFGVDLAGADAICAARAQAASLPGTYVAWRSSATVQARDRLGTARGWIRPDGKLVADRIEDLIAGQLVHPIRADERGEDVGVTGPSVATATDTTGTVASATCNGFTTTGSSIQIGTAWHTIQGWTDDSDMTCTTTLRLYCFGVDFTIPLGPTSVAGRRAFQTSTMFAVSGGLLAADAHCTNEATLAGITGSFRALLGTPSTPAMSRFALTGPPWVRVDGIPIASTPLRFMNGLVDTTVLDSLGVQRHTTVFTGGPPNAPAPASCGSWTQTTGTTSVGATYTSSAGLLDSSTGAPCSDPRPLYCLEE